MENLTCPLTLEPLRFPVTLRGARFEADALVAMLISDPRRVHPYERTALKQQEVQAILDAAMLDDVARQRLAELGCAALQRPALSPPRREFNEAFVDEVRQRLRARECRQTARIKTARRLALLIGFTLAATAHLLGRPA
jgi:hypothetical protein